MPSRRVSLPALENFLREKRLPAADSFNRSSEGGLPLDPAVVEVVAGVPMTEPGAADPSVANGDNGHSELAASTER